jgi:hypothetical protein
MIVKEDMSAVEAWNTVWVVVWGNGVVQMDHRGST